MGPSWHDTLLNILGIKIEIAAAVFLFRGSPDIVIGRRGLVTMGSSEEQEESSGDDSLVENAHQRNPMKGENEIAFPAKVGKVFTGSDILLVSKILRQLAKQKNNFRKFQVQGLLIDKLCGGYHCILSVELKDGASSDLTFKVTNSHDGLLDPGTHRTSSNHMVSGEQSV